MIKTVGQAMNPPMGGMGRDTWRVLLMHTTQAAVMHAALGVARRGDARSLTALCEELVASGFGDLIMKSIPLKLMDDNVGSYPVNIWDDEECQDWGVVTDAKEWSNVTLEYAVALCLSRTVVEGVVRQPRLKNEHESSIRTGWVPSFKSHLGPVQQELLDAAIRLYSMIPVRPHVEQPEGLVRLAQAVTGMVAWPGIVEAFSHTPLVSKELLLATFKGGSDFDNRSMMLLSHAVHKGNPVAALAIHDAMQRIGESADIAALFVQKAPGYGMNGLDMLARLRQTVVDDGLVEDPRFDALVQLWQRTCGGDARQVVSQTLEVLARHLGSVVHLGGPQAPWCEPFLDAVLQPLHELETRSLGEVLLQLHEEQPQAVCKAMDQVLSSACAPALALFRDALPRLMSASFWTDEPPYGGWSVLASARQWSAHSSMDRWRRTLTLLQEAGLDPAGRLERGDNLVAALRVHSTLLHLLAEQGGEMLLDRMAVLLEFGADPQALDFQGRTPAQCFSAASLSDATLARWHEICRVHQARCAAQQAVDAVALPHHGR